MSSSPPFKAGDGLLGLGLDERQLDLGMALREVGDGERDEGGAGRGERGEAHAPAAQTGDGLELVLGGGEPGEDAVGVLHQGPARVGQAHAARVALHERRSGLALEGGDLLRHGGLGVAEGIPRGGEGALLRDLAQDPQALDIDHKRTLSHTRRNVVCSYLTVLAS
jgi:hypothetical protein